MSQVWSSAPVDTSVLLEFMYRLAQALLGSGEQTLEIVTEVSHEAPDATSRQIVRSVLAGNATGTYLGRVAVARGAGPGLSAVALSREAPFRRASSSSSRAISASPARACRRRAHSHPP